MFAMTQKIFCDGTLFYDYCELLQFLYLVVSFSAGLLKLQRIVAKVKIWDLKKVRRCVETFFFYGSL